MASNVLTTDSHERASIRTEEGTILECLPEPFSGSGATGAATSFVYRPGGAPGEVGVFVTAPELKAALATVDPAADKTVVVDTSIAPAHLTAAESPWPLENVTFESGVTTAAILILDDGCTFDPGVHHLRLRNIELRIDPANAAPIWTPDSSGYLDLHTAAVLNSSGTAWIHLTGVVQLAFILAAASSIAGGVQATIENGAGAAVGVYDGSALAASSFVHGAAPGGTLALTLDGASQPNVSTAQDNANLTVTTTVLDPQAVFVFRPGGVTGGNVFTTWVSLYDAASLAPGGVSVLVDSTLATATVPTGTYNVDNWTFKGESSALSAAGRTLHFAEGAVFNFTNVYLQDQVVFLGDNTATPVMSPATGASIWIRMGASLRANTTAGVAPFVSVTAGTVLIFCFSFSSIGTTTTNNTVTVAAGATVIVDAVTKPTIRAHAFAGLGTLSVFADSSLILLTPQDITTTTINPFLDLANQVQYSPATAGNWNPAPAQVAPALDQLAAPNVVQATGNGGTGTGTVTVTSPGLSKAKSGQYDCTGSCSGSTAAAATVTAQLIRDVGAGPVVLDTQTVTTTAGQLNFFIALGPVGATLPDTAAHTFSIVLTCASNMTVAAGAGKVHCREF